MTKVELQGAFDVIRVAHEACEEYHEQFQNDKESPGELRLMAILVECAANCANRIQDKIDGWHEARKAAQWPYPTARERAEHNEP
mgnify:CR=1 FL=1